jgi:hypothetical protein
VIAAVIISLILGIGLGALGMLWLLDAMAKESGVHIRVNREGIHLWQKQMQDDIDAEIESRVDAELAARLNADTVEMPVYGRHAKQPAESEVRKD